MVTARVLEVKQFGIQWVARWWYLVGIAVWVIAYAIIWRAVVPATVVEERYTIWLPTNVQQAKEIRNYFQQPGRTLTGGSGGIGNAEILVSKEDFQRLSRDNLHNFVSAERSGGIPERFVVNYLSLGSGATFALSYQEPVPTIGFWYQVNTVRLEGGTLFVTYGLSDVAMLGMAILFFAGGGLFLWLVWPVLQERFARISSDWRTADQRWWD